MSFHVSLARSINGVSSLCQPEYWLTTSYLPPNLFTISIAISALFSLAESTSDLIIVLNFIVSSLFSKSPRLDDVTILSLYFLYRPSGKANNASITSLLTFLLTTSLSKLASFIVIVPFGSESLYSFRISAFLSSSVLIASSLLATETVADAVVGMAFLLTPPVISAICTPSIL